MLIELAKKDRAVASEQEVPIQCSLRYGRYRSRSVDRYRVQQFDCGVGPLECMLDAVDFDQPDEEAYGRVANPERY